ncbi:MAG: lactate utilization protein [Cytophagales bacterium]|nr:lactate utilization protein [Cytophagales bacterium]MDW8384817.1 lactate utilization protein B [Flammeovirgaceae bacterium]
MSATEIQHSKAAEKFISNEARTNWHDETLWWIRSKRDAATKSVPEWETLRELASQIKANVLSHLDVYLEEFEKNALQNGVKVHWAKDAEEHNQIVYNILQQKGATKMVKSKSMLTEDCHLNQYLQKRGIEVIDTDLGERIVQLRNEPPSHIVLPAIHLKKEDVGETFHRHLGTQKGAKEPKYLAEAARKHLREQFITAPVALSGVNFAIAETGGVVICTNEGNADLANALAPTHIFSMGIEKIIPKAEHLGVFIRLLARSATGQPSTAYTAHYHTPRKGAEMHIIIVDMGRTEQLGREDFRKSLYCIRCGACMNTCPVYRRSGGHSYGYTVPGPIGAILSPGVDMNKYASLPFASTLCGSCSDVCPVKIDIHEQLYKWRQKIGQKGLVSTGKTFSMRIAAFIFASPFLYQWSGKIGRRLLKIMPKALINNKFNSWTKQRDFPEPPAESFREWYLKRKILNTRM